MAVALAVGGGLAGGARAGGCSGRRCRATRWSRRCWRSSARVRPDRRSGGRWASTRTTFVAAIPWRLGLALATSAASCVDRPRGAAGRPWPRGASVLTREIDGRAPERGDRRRGPRRRILSPAAAGPGLADDRARSGRSGGGSRRSGSVCPCVCSCAGYRGRPGAGRLAERVLAGGGGGERLRGREPRRDAAVPRPPRGAAGGRLGGEGRSSGPPGFDAVCS